jgi:hypothetical protein
MKQNKLIGEAARRAAGVLAWALILGLVLAGCSKKDSGGGSASGGNGGTASVPKVGLAAPATDFGYDLSADGKGVVITKYTGNGGNLVIPAEIEGLPVVEIGGVGVFGVGSGGVGPGANITSVVIPASVKMIGDNAFISCQNLTSVTFLGTGVTLKSWCFRDCINLTDFKFPDGDKPLIPFTSEYGTVMGANAFLRCTKLPLAVRGKLKDMGFTDI